jgi:hypothetical protein
MSEEMKLRFARFILSRLLDIATNGGFSILWLDMSTGRALFKFDPSNEQAQELIRNVKVLQAGAA